MSRVQLALRVADLEGSIAFYSKLFGAEPAKRRPGYANFAIAEPPLKLVLIEGEEGQDTRMDHLGVEVDDTAQVDAATQRLKDAGLATAPAAPGTPIPEIAGPRKETMAEAAQLLGARRGVKVVGVDGAGTATNGTVTLTARSGSDPTKVATATRTLRR
ncbi:ArsI/CadI family heavy metal resistance metalloenzyme [Nonomuraea sp. B12E4]|uniref:ArsI/CadI family heavy metal resistance metalloenzyme n=1 Tax=Nonomuraea sp. B12E4 TaxID=3153564 RepID=UPI00325E8D8F